MLDLAGYYFRTSVKCIKNDEIGKAKERHMSANTIQDRASGAIMGALIGDAMALGPHWYYDLDELRRDYGDWIDGYTDPKPGRYHDGLKAGQLSQSDSFLP